MSTPKMNPDIKAKWVAALRSGAYRQGAHVLRTCTGEFCCLGVLCDLFAQEAGMSSWNAETFSDKSEGQFVQEHGDSQVPGARIAIWSGLDPVRKVQINGRWDSLYDHNDAGVTFERIATAIEEQL